MVGNENDRSLPFIHEAFFNKKKLMVDKRLKSTNYQVQRKVFLCNFQALPVQVNINYSIRK